MTKEQEKNWKRIREIAGIDALPDNLSIEQICNRYLAGEMQLSVTECIFLAFHNKTFADYLLKQAKGIESLGNDSIDNWMELPDFNF